MKGRDRQEWFWIALMVVAVAIMAWVTVAEWLAA